MHVKVLAVRNHVVERDSAVALLRREVYGNLMGSSF